MRANPLQPTFVSFTDNSRHIWLSAFLQCTRVRAYHPVFIEIMSEWCLLARILFYSYRKRFTGLTNIATCKPVNQREHKEARGHTDMKPAFNNVLKSSITTITAWTFAVWLLFLLTTSLALIT